MWELTHWRSALTNKLTYWWETYFLSMVKPMFDSLDVIVTAEEEISNLLCSEKRANPCSHYQGHFKPKHLRKNEVTSLPGIDCLRNWMRVCVCVCVCARTTLHVQVLFRAPFIVWSKSLCQGRDLLYQISSEMRILRVGTSVT